MLGVTLLLACTRTAEDTGPVAVPVSGTTAEACSGLYTVHIDAAEPDPPAVGDNVWTVRVNDGETDGISIIATPTMPEHGHGTVPETFTWDGSTIGPFDLVMPGDWLVVFDVTGPDGTDSCYTTLWVEG